MDQLANLVTVSLASYAAHVDDKVLRSWLDENAIRLAGCAGRKAGAWRRAAPCDAIRIALTARLLRYGFWLCEAAEILEQTFDVLLGEMAFDADAPMPQILERLAGARVTLSRELGRTHIALGNHPTAPREHSLEINLELIAKTEVAWRIWTTG